MINPTSPESTPNPAPDRSSSRGFLFYGARMPARKTDHHPVMEEFLKKLTPEQREEYEERAAIIEFDALVQRQLAEAWALLDLIKKIGWPKSRR